MRNEYKINVEAPAVPLSVVPHVQLPGFSARVVEKDFQFY